MHTQFIRRLFVVIPNASKASFNTWWANNIDTGGAGDKTFSIPLSATGNLPATYWGACTALTDAQFKTAAQRLCTLANITFPANWESMTRNEKRDWLRSQIVPIWQAIGVGIRVDDNDATWSDYDAALASVNLKRITGA